MDDSTKVIKDVRPNTAASEAGIIPGDRLVSVNGHVIHDIFDYQYECEDTNVEMTVLHSDGSEETCLLIKTEDEDPGLVFEDGIMDEYRRCHNKCIFCFIDQMPKGMRDTLYFKDDDSRLSFLQGNYVTLTNMSDEDIDRVIRYNLEPINISFQTTNPKLRCMMMGNRHAGDALKKADRLYEASIRMNGQIVLCKGINDGEELDRSLKDLSCYIPCLESVSVVPVGLSKHREGLYHLEPFTASDSLEVIRQIEGWQERIYKEHGIHFVHASDEWYLNAGVDIPPADRYDDFLQLENGVGMVRLLIDETEEAMKTLRPDGRSRRFSVATGSLVYPVIKDLTERMKSLFPNIEVMVYPIVNDFFGEHVTVSGLLTGRDICGQLKGKDLGDALYLPESLLRHGTLTLLDDMTTEDIQDALQVPVGIVKSDGASFTALYGENAG
ncbi:MAG: DUF512 domain-containing protein [Lachnospiraceae bacterium]|nr:DUF512 domain-containing protein [Lachnospiraceae bacterium]